MTMKPFRLVLTLGLLWVTSANLFAQANDTLPDTVEVAVDSVVVGEDTNTKVEPVVGIPDAEDLEVQNEIDQNTAVQFSLKSPYHTILSHLYFLQEDSYHPDSAAMTLYVQDPSSEAAQKLAIELKEFMDGAGYYIDLDDISRDPDYLDSASGKHKFAPIPEENEVFVYRKNGSRDWVYSYTTVNAIERLHNRIYPFGTFDWLPAWSKTKAGPLALWQYLGILLMLVVAILVQRLLTRLLSGLLRAYLFKLVRTDAGQNFFGKVARPISLLIVFYGVFAFISLLQLPISYNQWIVLAFRIMIPVFWMLIFLQIVNLVMAIFAKRAEATETTMDDQVVPLLRRLFHGIVVVVFVIIILDVLRVNVDALLGGLAFGSLALALAAQDTVKNLFGSLLIFVDRPFQIGDWVTAQGHEGTVEEVSVRSTRIRTFAGSLVSIPNGALADGPIDNMGLRVYRRFVTKVGVTYDTTPELLEVFVEGIKELVRNHPTTLKDRFEVHFNEMGDFSLQILVYVFFDVPTWTDELAGRQRLLIGIMKLANTLGVGFAFPTQTLHIDSFPERQGLTPEHNLSTEAYRKQMKDFVEGWKKDYKPRDLGTKQDGAEG